MISERKLAAGFSSVWRELLPRGEAFTRRVNLQAGRFAPPLLHDAPAERSALISELGFRLYGAHLESLVDLYGEGLGASQALAEIASGAFAYVQALPRMDHPLAPVSDAEVDVAVAYARRMQWYFASAEPEKTLTLSPIFKGCGIVDSCRGDVLAGTRLYEIKNVERDFRAADIRQVLVYTSLGYAAGEPVVDSVGLLNARTGRFFFTSMEGFAYGLAGTSASELLSSVVAFITSEQLSR